MSRIQSAHSSIIMITTTSTTSIHAQLIPLRPTATTTSGHQLSFDALCRLIPLGYPHETHPCHPITTSQVDQHTSHVTRFIWYNIRRLMSCHPIMAPTFCNAIQITLPRIVLFGTLPPIRSCHVMPCLVMSYIMSKCHDFQM